MNIDQQIDDRLRTVLVTISGEMSDADLLRLADLLEKTPGMSQSFSILYDLRFADGSKITSDGVRALAARKLIFSTQSRRGVVVPSLLGFGMARMYSLFRGAGAPRVFMDYDKARRWVETGSE